VSARAFLGLSHTPLMGLNPIAPDVERMLSEGIEEARRRVLEFAPELIVLVAPDHYNGFYNELMPPFCVGTCAQSVGDYLTPAGDLNVDETSATALVEALINEDFDIAISHRMRVDHGFAQPLQLLWGGLDTPPVVPLFLNAVATPVVPRMRRCRALGQAIGSFFRDETRRVLFIGSGGLSHEPPVPTMADSDPAVRERITLRQEVTQAEHDLKTQRVMAAGMALASGKSSLKPLNPAWDKHWMDALAGDAQALDDLCNMTEESIALDAGRSAHESKTWLIARSALSGLGVPLCKQRFYLSIPEYIAGFGILHLEQNLQGSTTS
jgi:2,3-dihydroxyphenylpropionate 1,2-dioxygenase